MAWWRSGKTFDRRWAILNGCALGIWLYVMTQGSAAWHQPGDGFDSMLESGKWAIRLLLLCLAMTPLHTYLGWNGALKLRKSLGLWAFAFGSTHFVLYAIETWEPYAIYRTGATPWHWLSWPMHLYVALGLVALLILTTLALTSNRWSMRRLGKNWKRLHRLVYGAGIVILCHALLAAGMSKKMMVRDPHAVTEMWVYGGALAVLLLLRVPQVRTLLKRVPSPAHPRVVPKLAKVPLPKPYPATLPLTRIRPETMADIPAPLVGDKTEEVEEEREVAY